MKRCPECGKPYDNDLTYCPDDGYMLVPETGGEDDDPYLGAVFENRYRVVKRVGEGGMGSVYLARNINAEMDVALKVLTAAASKDENVVKRFEAEKRIIAKLRHPNILKLNDSFRAPGGELVIVMEYVNGQPLDELIRDETLSAARTMYIVREVCDALTEAHETGIIHRDLKPSNLMIEHVGDRDIVKILDFGIAKNLEGAEGLTMGHALGTPAYMSPEQVRGSAELDGRSDIYSLGIVAYECLVGKPPFLGSTPYSIIHKHINELPKPLHDVVPPINCDAEAEALIMSLLEKDPDARPANCKEVRDKADWLYHKLKAADGEGGYGSVNFSSTEMGMGGSLNMSAQTLHGAGVRQSGNKLLVALSIIAIIALAGAAWVMTQEPTDAAADVSAGTSSKVQKKTAATAAPKVPKPKPAGPSKTAQTSANPGLAAGVTPTSPVTPQPANGSKPLGTAQPTKPSATAVPEIAPPSAAPAPPTEPKAQEKPENVVKEKPARKKRRKPRAKARKKKKKKKKKASKAKYSDDLFE